MQLGYIHRVGRVLSFFSSRRNWDSPTPLSRQASVPPHPMVRGGGGHTRERGWGSPNSDEGTYTVVLFIYEYFVAISLAEPSGEEGVILLF
jgi:hypothetical protein